MKDKITWITGGGSGIGRALAMELADRGSKIALSGRRKDRLDQVVTEIEKKGGTALAIPCDVTDDQSVKEAVQAVLDHFGKLDIVIANAGFGVVGKVGKLTLDDWKRQFDTNVFGVISTINHSLEELKKTRGRLVLMGSVMGSACIPGSGPYQVSKYAIRALSQTLSMELRNTGVSCTHIQPGFVESEIGQVDNQGVFHGEKKDHRPSKFMWSTERAARVIARAIHKRKRDFVFTGHGKLLVFLGHHFPGLIHFLTRFVKRKPAK